MLEGLREAFRRLGPRHGVVYAVLYGSRAVGRARPDSDVDIAVKFRERPDLMSLGLLIAELEEAVGVEVDLKPVDLDDYVHSYEVFSRGLLVYGDEGEFLRDRHRAVMNYLDFEPYLRRAWQPGLVRCLSRLDRALRLLEELAGGGRGEVATAAMERELQVAIEALLDLGHAVISAEGREVPPSYKAVAEVLARHGVLTADEAVRLKALAGLRNVLVRGYAEVDDGALWGQLGRIVADVRQIRNALVRYVEGRGIDPP